MPGRIGSREFGDDRFHHRSPSDRDSASGASSRSTDAINALTFATIRDRRRCSAPSNSGLRPKCPPERATSSVQTPPTFERLAQCSLLDHSLRERSQATSFTPKAQCVRLVG